MITMKMYPPYGFIFHKRVQLLFVLLVFLVAGVPKYGAAQSMKPGMALAPPNIIVLFADDMGYGDLGSYGHPTIRTPNIDRLAGDGIRFTSFVTGNWCVPSRTQLITGRYMNRINFEGHTGADGTGGIPDSVLTLAEGLKKANYQTAMLGKWHLGYKEDRFLPPNQGFDYWFGLPYSNDYMRPWVQTDEPLVLYRNLEIIEHPIEQTTLTQRYTAESIRYITAHAHNKQPFFLYLAYNMPHLPLQTTDQFRGRSNAGLYGDVIEELDWSVGQILETLEDQGIAGNTLVFFASDNGPWLNLPNRMKQNGIEVWHAGSPGPLRGSKATTYEGGSRVPAIIRWPGTIAPGQVTDQLVASLDIYRTLLQIAAVDVGNEQLDGYDLLPFLTGQAAASPRNEYPYFLGDDETLQAFREGAWKLRLGDMGPELYNLQEDPAERHNRAASEQEIGQRLRQKMEKTAANLRVSVYVPASN